MPRVKPTEMAEPAIKPSSTPVARRLDGRIDELQAELDALRAQRAGTVDEVTPPPLIRMTPEQILADRQAVLDGSALPLFLRIRGERPGLAPALDAIDPDSGKRTQPGPEPLWTLRNGQAYMSNAPGFMQQRSTADPIDNNELRGIRSAPPGL